MAAFLAKFYSIIISLSLLFLSNFGFAGVVPEKFSPEEDGLLFSAALISDTHIDYRLPLGQINLARGLTDMKSSTAKIDALVVSGDLTNFSDNESLTAFFNDLRLCSGINNTGWVIATGNHDVGHADDAKQTHEQARQSFISTFNKYTGRNIDKVYYSAEVNGYHFIVLGDEGDDTWDHDVISDEQLSFLDSELAKYSQAGKPVFVVLHQPLEGVNGQESVWADGSVGDQSAQIQAILEKYQNVFMISGHMHAGATDAVFADITGHYCVETVNGVNYINLPTYGLVNHAGVPLNGIGYQLEVYQSKVIIRVRDYLESDWFEGYEYTIDLSM